VNVLVDATHVPHGRCNQEMEQSMGLSVTTQNAIIKKADVDRYQLVLFNRTGSVVVVRSSDDNSYSLPIMGVPRFTRLAEELTTLLRSRWSVETVLLFAGRRPIPKKNIFTLCWKCKTESVQQ